MTQEIYPKVVRFRPDGPQGAKIDLQIDSPEQDQEFEQKLHNLPIDQKNTSGLLGVIKKVGLKRIDTYKFILRSNIYNS